MVIDQWIQYKYFMLLTNLLAIFEFILKNCTFIHSLQFNLAPIHQLASFSQGLPLFPQALLLFLSSVGALLPIRCSNLVGFDLLFRNYLFCLPLLIIHFQAQLWGLQEASRAPSRAPLHPLPLPPRDLYGPSLSLRCFFA